MYEIASIAIAVVLAVGVALLVVRHRRAAGEVLTEVAPRSLVRVLATEDEVREAARRAAGFEEIAAAAIDARTRRYQRLAGPTTPASLHVVDAVDLEIEDPPPRSA